MKDKVWFVTGASKGLGLALVKKLLAQGYRVAATSRTLNGLEKAVQGNRDQFLPIEMDIVTESSVSRAIKQTVDYFGKIDVVINNAGYGLTGSLEELSDAEARENFDVNVFGSLNVIRQVMPYLRKQRSGHIFNVASIGGFTGQFPGFGIYCAGKFAIHGLSESLAAEVESFNVHVTIVSPGYFRTNFLDSSLAVPKNEIGDYKLVREVQTLHQHDYNGNQAGDPDKAAEVFILTAEQAMPPLHLFLGADAYNLAKEKIHFVETQMNSVQELATATNFN